MSNKFPVRIAVPLRNEFPARNEFPVANKFPARNEFPGLKDRQLKFVESQMLLLNAFSLRFFQNIPA